jgi:hypothetical protein
MLGKHSTTEPHPALLSLLYSFILEASSSFSFIAHFQIPCFFTEQSPDSVFHCPPPCGIFPLEHFPGTLFLFNSVLWGVSNIWKLDNRTLCVYHVSNNYQHMVSLCFMYNCYWRVVGNSQVLGCGNKSLDTDTGCKAVVKLCWKEKYRQEDILQDRDVGSRQVAWKPHLCSKGSLYVVRAKGGENFGVFARGARVTDVFDWQEDAI